MTTIRSLVFTGTSVVLATAVLHAQSPQSVPKPLPGSMTITGCVERADQMSAAFPGTTVDSLSFVLVNQPQGASPASSPASGTAGTAGAVGTSGSTEKPVTYRLDGDLNTLNPHVGHKVEITGIVQAAADGAAADATASTLPPTLKVASIKMIAETCPR